MIALNNTPCRVVEKILAVVLALAACLKAYDLFLISRPFHVGPLDYRLLVSILIASELLLALWLTVGGFDHQRVLCGIACFALFSVVSFNEAYRAVTSCGCFGNVKVPPAITGIFDLSAAFALWLTIPNRTVPVTFQSIRNPLAIATALLLVVTAAAPAYIRTYRSLAANVNGGPVALEPDSWLNQPFSLLNSIDGGTEMKTGRWLLIFYHFDCDECLHAIPKYRAISEAIMGQPNPPQIAFVAIPPFAPAAEDPGHASSDTRHFSLRSDRDWIATTPLVVTLRNGRVTSVIEGEQATNPLDLPQ